MKILFLLLSLLVGSQANAGYWNFGPLAEGVPGIPPGMTFQRLLVMTNDRDADIRDLNLLLDADVKVTGVHVLNESDAAENKSFLLDRIESKDGAVLLMGSGRKAIIMNGKLNRDTQEGRFTLKYLANGLSMRYESCDFDLKKDGSNWLVRNAYTGEVVSKINILSYSLGITTIEGICPKK